MANRTIDIIFPRKGWNGMRFIREVQGEGNAKAAEHRNHGHTLSQEGCHLRPQNHAWIGRSHPNRPLSSEIRTGQVTAFWHFEEDYQYRHCNGMLD